MYGSMVAACGARARARGGVALSVLLVVLAFVVAVATATSQHQPNPHSQPPQADPPDIDPAAPVTGATGTGGTGNEVSSVWPSALVASPVVLSQPWSCLSDADTCNKPMPINAASSIESGSRTQRDQQRPPQHQLNKPTTNSRMPQIRYGHGAATMGERIIITHG